VERLRAELAEVTAARNTAQQQLEQVIHDRDQETLAVQRLTVANRNCQRMLAHVMNQRDEAWHEENVLRARQVELEQRIEAAEEYNDNLHEEVHRLNNQLNPLLPHDNNEDEEMARVSSWLKTMMAWRSMDHKMFHQKKKKKKKKMGS
jgi:chromosome segregation ATPase